MSDTTDNGWIGVDLDGTLAYYDHWRGEMHIGPPIPLMMERVVEWIEAGITVRIMTARASTKGRSVAQRRLNTFLIKDWCEHHLGYRLEVTSEKDMWMKELWDDRAVRVELNTGRTP